jgi:hypothetical protein
LLMELNFRLLFISEIGPWLTDCTTLSVILQELLWSIHK